MELVRKTDVGDTMYPEKITILPQHGDVKTGWSDPVIEMTHKVVDSRNGAITKPEGIGFDRLSISDAVARGIWSPEEAQMMVGLCLKLYCMVGQPVEATDGN